MKVAQIRATHLVETVEKAYSLDGPDDRWLDSVLGSAHVDLHLGFGTYAFTCRIAGEQFDVDQLFSQRQLAPSFLPLITEINADVPVEAIRTMTRTHAICQSHETFFGREHPSVQRFKRIAGPGGYADAMSVFVQDSEGHAVNLSAPSATPIVIHPRVAAMWRRAGMHVVAAWRLRRRLANQALTRDALLDDRGKLHDAGGDVADDHDARRALVEAAAQMDRARSKERATPERALELWRGLVSGRWSLVDHWEKGGRRFIAAYRNTPELRDPRALSALERSIVRSLWLGASNKEIAFDLGVPFASVTAAVRRVLRKLRCPRREALVALGDPATWRVETTLLGGRGELGVAASAERTGAKANLTRAERAVVERVLAGDSNAAIARRRKTSVNTVANQLQTIYRRLGVRNRAELILVLGRRAE